MLDSDTNREHSTKWLGHNLVDFNLYLKFKDIQDQDYQEMRQRLNFALEQIEKEEEAVLLDEGNDEQTNIEGIASP